MQTGSSHSFAGPTHDDITYDSLASAFGEFPCVRDLQESGKSQHNIEYADCFQVTV